MSRINTHSIELDCPPGGIRPNDLIEGVLKDSGFTVGDFATGAPFFGHQTWILKEEAGKDELFREIRLDVFKPRVEALYHAGLIRFGSW